MASSPGEARSQNERFERRLGYLLSVAVIVSLFLLFVFALAVAVTNDRAAATAQRRADIASLSEAASEALSLEEDAADDVIVENDAASRRAHVTARGEVDMAIRALPEIEPSVVAARSKDELLELHAGYGAAAAEMFARFAGGSVADAEVFEEAHLDPYFDPLADALTAARRDSDDAARGALLSVRRSQQLLLIVMPLVSGVTLALITVFVVKLSRSRGEIVRQSEESSYQSLHDGLTGLPNRSFLQRSSALALARAANSGKQMALMVLDLDRFKEINDTLGHHAGDVVLEVVSHRLRSAVRSTDTVARLGGDEFAILLPHVTDAAAALEVAIKAQKALVKSIDAGNVAVDVDVSIGIALSGEHGQDVATLLKHADIAMYRAKRHDLGIGLYDAESDDNSPERLGLLGELRRALDHGELILYFQPKIELASGAFCGAEALVRWAHPTRGMILPGSFLPAAERTAMIRPLTRHVIDVALGEARRWKDDGKDLLLAVNISARNLLDTKFPDHVAELLDKWGLAPTCLVFEVTESAIIVEPEQAEAMLFRFADLGIELAIDDFGAGYTSLAHLRTLPVQELKIDQSLVGQMAVSARDAVIVRGVIDLASNLGLRTVAEGIEDAATLDRLTLMGCDIGQGFHIAKPMTGAELSRWCDERETSARTRQPTTDRRRGEGVRTHGGAPGARFTHPAEEPAAASERPAT